jgi:hypothetical protein
LPDIKPFDNQLVLTPAATSQSVMPEYHCLMSKKWFILLALVVLGITAYPQVNPRDSSINNNRVSSIDTSFDYDELMQDLDDFLDSILLPHSYFLGSLSLSRNYFTYENKGSDVIQTVRKINYSPTLGYYHKSGLGITAIGYIVNDQSHSNFYQLSVAPSYDYLANRDLATGISFTRYFTKDSLAFYTSPLQNDLYAYFTWRKSWIRPSIAVSYGWGSRSDYQEREELITSLRLRPRGYTYVNTRESVSDFSLVASLRHDFYWLDVLGYNDHIRFTPQLSFTSGTQKFGFNQTSSTYGTLVRTGTNVLYSSENVYLDDQLKFQPLSLTFYLRGEYSIGKFFVQPQFALDYYFPSSSNNFSTLFSVNTGFMF